MAEAIRIAEQAFGKGTRALVILTHGEELDGPTALRLRKGLAELGRARFYRWHWLRGRLSHSPA